MMKLEELTDEVIDWYYKKIEDKVKKRIEECKKNFQKKYNNINETKILEELNNIEQNLDKLLKNSDLQSLISNNKNYICNFQKIKKKKKKKKELLYEYNENCEIMNMIKLEERETKNTIINKIDELNEKNDEFKEKLNSLLTNSKEKYDNIFSYIFDYSILGEDDSNENKVTLRHMILSKMNRKTCPYCDRQYVTNYNESHSTADLDHFYPQSKYPYLALNIYNFIPSCAICNRNFKKAEEIKINPRIEEFGKNGIFILKNKRDTLMDLELKDIEIDIETNGKQEDDIEVNIGAFKLKEVYKVHNDYVLQMIKDINFRANTNYLNSLKEFFIESNEEKIISILRNTVLKPYKFKIENNEPLGKLTKDILDNILIVEEREKV